MVGNPCSTVVSLRMTPRHLCSTVAFLGCLSPRHTLTSFSSGSGFGGAGTPKKRPSATRFNLWRSTATHYRTIGRIQRKGPEQPLHSRVLLSKTPSTPSAPYSLLDEISVAHYGNSIPNIYAQTSLNTRFVSSTIHLLPHCDPPPRPVIVPIRILLSGRHDGNDGRQDQGHRGRDG